MTDTLQKMIEGANSNNLFMQCDSPNEKAFRPLPRGFTSRLCKHDEIIVWKEMWAQGKYMDFVNYYCDAVYAPHEVKLYSDFGFKLITEPVIGYRKNDLNDSLPYLLKVLPESDYAGLQLTEANEELLTAALSSEFAEF